MSRGVLGAGLREWVAAGRPRSGLRIGKPTSDLSDDRVEVLLDLMAPNSQYLPTPSPELAEVAQVTCPIGMYFLSPVWIQLVLPLSDAIAVPKIPVYENRQPGPGEGPDQDSRRASSRCDGNARLSAAAPAIPAVQGRCLSAELWTSACFAALALGSPRVLLT